METMPVSENELGQQELDKTILKDFYISFKLSQGDSNTQQQLFGAIVGYYKQYLGFTQEQISKAFELAKERIKKLHPPSRHVEVGQEFIDNALTAEIMHFEEANMVEDGITLDDIENLLLYIIGRDAIYQEGMGRPKKNPDEDPYSSHFRDYVLNGQPTGSQTIDRILEIAGKEIGLVSSNVEYINLVNLWEANHPGEKFEPKEPLATT